MKTRTLISIVGAGMMLLCSSLVWAMPSANPPCPQLGWANGCNTIITLNPNNTATIQTTSAEAYDGSEDQLVGVINNSGSTVGGITLSGLNIFGFDQDGAFSNTCLYVVAGAPYSCGTPTPGDTTGYAGPNTSFSIVDYNNGTVNFIGGLISGATSVFSLEESPGSGGFTVTSTNPSVPEPGNLILFGLGIAGLGLLLWRQKKTGSKMLE